MPPTQLTILDHHGAAVRDQTAGPYLEGDSINLTCLSSGGIPPPRVSWWREHALVDDSFQVLPDGTVRNVLHLKNISRKDLLTVSFYFPFYFLLFSTFLFVFFSAIFFYRCKNVRITIPFTQMWVMANICVCLCVLV